MPRLGPLSYRDFIRYLRVLGFEGPYSGGRHLFMVRDGRQFTNPNDHGEDLSRDLVRRLLRHLHIGRDSRKHSEGTPVAGGEVVLLLGGARSGKSRLAVDLARRAAGPVVFLAAGQAGDGEMADRIDRHRRERPAEWRTIERSRELGAVIRGIAPGTTVLLDGLGDIATEYLLAGASEEADLSAAELAEVEAGLEAEVAGIVAAARAAGAALIVVSNEVGLGLVPPYPLGRHYRDVLGRANQRLAAEADRVYFLIAGLPLRLKPSPEPGS